MTTNEDKVTPIKATRRRKGVSDKTLYKYIKLARDKFGLTDEDSIESLLFKLADSVMDGDG